MKRRGALLLALALHALLATGYAWITPAFEAPDENGHYYYATFVAQRGEQPIVLGSHAATGRSVWDESDLGHHPPGYYAVLAGLLHAVGLADSLPTQRGRGPAPGPLQWEHYHDEGEHKSRELRGLFALRLFSVLCGLASVWFAHATVRVLWPDRPAVADLTALLLACLPQWSYAHGCLDNGNLANTLSHLVGLLLAITLARRALTSGRAVAIGLALGAALWTKASALALGPTIGLVIAWLAWREPSRRRSLLAGGAVALAIGGAMFTPLVVRNLDLYGDPLGQAAHAAAFARSKLPDGPTMEWLFVGFPAGLGRSFVGLFGWWRIALPEFAYLLAAAIAALGLAGHLAMARRTPSIPGARLLLIVTAAGAFAVVLRFNLTFAQPQGRYLFPAGGAIAALVAVGLIAVGDLTRRLRALPAIVALLAAIGAVAALVGVARPAFSLPAPNGDPHLAILAGGLSSDTPRDAIGIELLDPPDAATLSAPPTFRFEPAAGGAPVTLHLWLASGRVLVASWEMIRLDLSAGTFALPADIWAVVPPGEELRWNVRRVADRQACEDPRAMPGSPTRSLSRR